jgi:hypothetical protein
VFQFLSLLLHGIMANGGYSSQLSELRVEIQRLGVTLMQKLEDQQNASAWLIRQQSVIQSHCQHIENSRETLERLTDLLGDFRQVCARENIKGDSAPDSTTTNATLGRLPVGPANASPSSRNVVNS